MEFLRARGGVPLALEFRHCISLHVGKRKKRRKRKMIRAEHRKKGHFRSYKEKLGVANISPRNKLNLRDDYTQRT
jgi:hypothetical protein